MLSYVYSTGWLFNLGFYTTELTGGQVILPSWLRCVSQTVKQPCCSQLRQVFTAFVKLIIFMSSAAISWCSQLHETLTAQHLYDASNTFQRLFNIVLSDLSLENVVIYFDPSDTWKSLNKCLSGLVKKKKKVCSIWPNVRNREFCYNFALATPLSDFVGPKIKFGWTDDASLLFNRSRICLAGLLTLKRPDVICH